jgi:hypothetical protein
MARSARPRVQFGPIGYLPGLEDFGGRVGVPTGLRDCVEKLHLQPAVPHFDARAFERADAEQGRRRMQLLEITTNCRRFGDHFAVVELKRRYGLERIENREGRRLVLQAGQIHVDGRHRHSLFRQEDAHAPGIGRKFGIV